MIFLIPIFFATLASANTQQYQIYKQIAFSKSENMNRRWSSLMGMSDAQPYLAKKDLKTALQQPEWFVRNAALLSLNKISQKEAQVAARSLLKDQALVVRSAAVEVLDSSLEENRIALWNELKEPRNFRKSKSLWIRSQIMKKLSQPSRQTEKKNFLTLLSDEDDQVRQIAKNALNKMTD